MKQNRSLDDRTRRSVDVLALIAFCGFFFIAGIQLIGLVGADEPRYAQIAREMLQRHDWVTPVLYGHPWLEKPPLFYWCAMVAYKGAGGVSDWAARLPSAILCSLLVFFIYVWVRHFRRGMQLDAALITASSAWVIGFGCSASTDMPLAVMFTAAMLCWYGWHSSQDRGWLLGFYLFLGLGTLAKGPVAVFLAALIIVIFAALRRDGRLLLRTLWPVGIVLYLAVTLPWFIAVQRANPEFFRFFFLQQNLARYTTAELYHRHQPFWYYVPVALLALVPWTVFVIAAVVDAMRDWRYSVEEPPGTEDLRTFLTLWLLLPILFFSFSQSKLPGYILPSVPAGAILLADFIRRREEEAEKPGTWLALAHALLSAATLAATFIISFKLAKQQLVIANIAVVAALAIACLVSLWLSLYNYGYRLLLVTLLPVLIAFALTLKGTAPRIDLLQSARPVQSAIASLGDVPTVAVYDVPRAVEYGLAFYRNQPISSYERNEIPSGDHLVVAASGSQKELEYRLPGRLVTRVGGFAWQHLDFYLISASVPSQAHP